MYLMDYGKSAATFVETETGQAYRITAAHGARTRASDYAPGAPDRWHAQLHAYQIMPDAELLQAEPVNLMVSLDALISHHGGRVVCAECGEDIINEREVYRRGRLLCRACADGAYCVGAPDSAFVGQTAYTPRVSNLLCQIASNGV